MTLELDKKFCRSIIQYHPSHETLNFLHLSEGLLDTVGDFFVGVVPAMAGKIVCVADCYCLKDIGKLRMYPNPRAETVVVILTGTLYNVVVSVHASSFLVSDIVGNSAIRSSRCFLRCRIPMSVYYPYYR